MKQEEIVQAVREGRAMIPAFVEVAPGIEVWCDALKIDGVRVGVSARTAQRVADVLGLTLTSAAVEDLVYQRAAVVLPPYTFNPNTHAISSDATVAAHSRAIDTELSKRGATPGALVATVGKAWVLDPVLASKQGRAANYGWHGKSAAYAAKTPGVGVKVWQPLGTAHNLDHHDYSQTLRLCRLSKGALLPGAGGVTRVPGVAVEAQVVEEDDVATVPEAISLGELAVAIALEEMRRENPPSAATVARYHSIAVRNGRPLGITKGNHCASAASWCALEAAKRLGGVPLPHAPRAGAKELLADATRVGLWHAIGGVRDGLWRPAGGDLAIYDRSVPGRPETSWWGHVDRVVRVFEDRYECIGANEGPGGAWRVEVTRFDHARLLGFIAYPRAGAEGASCLDLLGMPSAIEMSVPDGAAG